MIPSLCGGTATFLLRNKMGGNCARVRRPGRIKPGRPKGLQEVEGKLIRITVPRDEMKIISVGPIRPSQVRNLLSQGDLIPLP